MLVNFTDITALWHCHLLISYTCYAKSGPPLLVPQVQIYLNIWTPDNLFHFCWNIWTPRNAFALSNQWWLWLSVFHSFLEKEFSFNNFKPLCSFRLALFMAMVIQVIINYNCLHTGKNISRGSKYSFTGLYTMELFPIREQLAMFLNNHGPNISQRI